jgi:hypothetical protein
MHKCKLLFIEQNQVIRLGDGSEYKVSAIRPIDPGEWCTVEGVRLILRPVGGGAVQVVELPGVCCIEANDIHTLLSFMGLV